MSASLDLKSKEEKDAELDKRIEALRRKNQALIKRYQEIEEDRKKAEQEGIAVTGVHRRPRSAEGEGPERRRGELDAPTLTVQVLLSPEEKRLVSSDRKTFRPSPAAPRGSVRGAPYPGSRSPRAEGPPEAPRWEGSSPDGPAPSKRGGGRGGRGQRARGRGGPAGDAGPDRRSKEWEERRRQNIEKMNEEMEKIAEYERSQRQDGVQEKNPVRNFLDDPRRSGALAETDRREGSRRHVRNWGGADFDKVKTGMEQGKQWSPPGRGGARRRGASDASALDMTLSMTGRERAEYVRWKQEREQIDRERLARHRQPTGEWRREWDAEKMEAALKEGAKPSGPGGGRHDESKRPPKPPTFGQFLAEPQAERRRKGRGRGGRRGGGAGPPKPYSMHDNRWEEQEEQPAPDRAPAHEGEQEGKAVAQQAGPPASPTPGPAGEKEEEEEEEDQWEDVSEGEEEEEAEGSQGLSAEEPEAEGPGLPPLSLAMPPPEAETPSAEGKPLTPFSPAEGYCPVSDWGEAMELSSPRANPTQNPLAAPGEGLPGMAGMKPPDLSAEQGSPQAPHVPSAEGVTPPGPKAAPSAEMREDEEDLEDMTPGEGGGGGDAPQEPGEPGAAMDPASAAASSTVEITGFQRERTEEA